MTTNISTVAKKVTEVLDQQEAAKKFGLRVVEEGTRQQDGWFYVLVQATVPGMRAYDFVDVLMKVEQIVRDQEHNQHVVVLPAA